MGAVTKPPSEEAREVFTDLGYELSGDGPEFSARRDWKEVRVTAVAGPLYAPDEGQLRCFVTWSERADDVSDAVERVDPSYDWAVVAVREDGSYEVVRAPT